MSIKLGFLTIETDLCMVVDDDMVLLEVDGRLLGVLSVDSPLFDLRLRIRDLGGGGKARGANPPAGDEGVVIGLTIPSFWCGLIGPLERFLIAFGSEVNGRALALLAAPEFPCKVCRGARATAVEVGDAATRLPDL
jgi:hypothetical protein